MAKDTLPERLLQMEPDEVLSLGSVKYTERSALRAQPHRTGRLALCLQAWLPCLSLSFSTVDRDAGGLSFPRSSRRAHIAGAVSQTLPSATLFHAG